MKMLNVPIFNCGEIEYEQRLISEKEDIQNALSICYAAKKAIKKDIINIDDFLIKDNENGKFYTLKNSDLPICFSEKAIMIDGFKDCLKRLIKRLEEIKDNNEEVYTIKVLRREKKPNTN